MSFLIAISALSKRDLVGNLLQRKFSPHLLQYSNKLRKGIFLKEGDNIYQNECYELRQTA